MKKLTTTKLLSKLENLNVNKTTIAYNKVLSVVKGETITIRPVYISGSGRHTKNCDHTIAIVDLLNKLEIPNILSNDAPKGGLTGNLITITAKVN